MQTDSRCRALPRVARLRTRVWAGRIAATALIVLTSELAGAAAEAAGQPTRLPRLAAGDFDRAAAAHLLNRAGFGGTPREIDDLAALGLDGAVDRVLEGSGGEPPADFVATITERPSRLQLFGLSEQERQRVIREHRTSDQQQLGRLRAWWLRRMVLTPHPLEEKMTLFWHGHFATSQVDVRNSYHMYLQNRTLRQHALGNFRELVTAIAKDPAMLEYLDNNTNNRNRPNENFARELMELFTLGVGNYSEDDIKEAARALTGWTFRGNEFVFARYQHDPGEKTFLGRRGRFTGDEVIGILFEQPAASRFVVRKLLSYFAHEDAPEEVVESLAEVFRASGFEIRPVLSELFRSAEFYSERSRGTQVLGPVQLVVRTLRLLELDPGPSPFYAGIAGQMGQELFAPPSVKGWDGGQSWISTSTLFDRRNYPMLVLGLAPPEALARRPAGRLAARFAVPQWSAYKSGARLLGEDFSRMPAEQVVDLLIERFLLVGLGERARRELVESYEQAAPATRLAELIHLILSSPQYQLG